MMKLGFSAAARALHATEKLSAAREQFEAVGQSERQLKLKIADLQAELKDALNRADQMQGQLQARRSEDKMLNRELVGLSGPLRRVAILETRTPQVMSELRAHERIRGYLRQVLSPTMTLVRESDWTLLTQELYRAGYLPEIIEH